MGISDWSSDVCSSDLRPRIELEFRAREQRVAGIFPLELAERNGTGAGAHFGQHDFRGYAAMYAGQNAGALPFEQQDAGQRQELAIGRASWREREGRHEWIAVASVS